MKKHIESEVLAGVLDSGVVVPLVSTRGASGPGVHVLTVVAVHLSQPEL